METKFIILLVLIYGNIAAWLAIFVFVLYQPTKRLCKNIMNHPRTRLLFRRPAARAYNDKGERIESMRFTVPALRVGVIEYPAGQLTTGNSELEGKAVRLYYPPEAVSDKKFLKTLETAPVVVGSHDSTTSENNKKIDGWASAVRYDETAKAAIIDGVVKGKTEIEYIKENISAGNQNDFGASAFIDIFGLKVESGITPDGESYNAIATDLRATHVALAPHVRDPKNKIQVNNAVVINSNGEINREVKKVGLSKEDREEIAAIVKNAINEAAEEKSESDKTAALESKVKELSDKLEAKEALEVQNEDEKKAAAEAEKKTAEEDKKDEEGSVVENAKPSQAVISAFSTAMNIDFGRTTPSFSDLATLAGIKEDEPFARIAAVNAKFAEITSGKPAGKDDKNSTVEVF